MKISIYGVSRAGKDYLIEKLVAKAKNLTHIKGSATLKMLSEKNLSKPFSQTSEEEKNLLRTAFIGYAEEIEKASGNIVIDGHYAFPKDNGGYNVVFTAEDRDFYDFYVYLKTPVERIIENQKQPADKIVKQYSEEEIIGWQQFEIAQMQEVCKNIDKELIVLNGDTVTCIGFLLALISSPQEFQVMDIARRIIDCNLSQIKDTDTVLLTDCDKTLSLEDTGNHFCALANIDTEKIKNVYRGDYYSVFQSYRADSILLEGITEDRYAEICRSCVQSAEINSNLIEDIKSHKGYFALGLTAGFTEIWSKIVERFNLNISVSGKNYEGWSYYVSANVKYAVAKLLRQMGKFVIAVGDGILDLKMLEEADRGYVIAQSKLSGGVRNYFKNNNSKIMQLKYNQFKYDGIKEVSSIWE